MNILDSKYLYIFMLFLGGILNVLGGIILVLFVLGPSFWTIFLGVILSGIVSIYLAAESAYFWNNLRINRSNFTSDKKPSEDIEIQHWSEDRAIKDVQKAKEIRQKIYKLWGYPDFANDELHNNIFDLGIHAWNNWRKENPDIRPVLIGISAPGKDLRNIDLSNCFIRNVEFSGCNLENANFSNSEINGGKIDRAGLMSCRAVETSFSYITFYSTSFRNATLSKASFRECILTSIICDDADLQMVKMSNTQCDRASFKNSLMSKACLLSSSFVKTLFIGAKLDQSKLMFSNFVQSNFSHADLSGSDVYGTSAWNVTTEGARQNNLRITRGDEVAITTDTFELAQFVYLILNNEKLRTVIDTITSKAVLILGRFTGSRIEVLNKIRYELRARGYLPILFDFKKPKGRDLTETISTLAHLSKFIIADITDAKCIPQELQAIVPNLPSLPIIPIIHASDHEYGMFEHFKRYSWVREPFIYNSLDHLISSFEDLIL